MRLLPRRPLARLTLTCLVLLGGAAAYVKHAQSKDPLAALPGVGTALPGFDFPFLRGPASPFRGDDRFSAASLTGAPALLVLWSSDCTFSRQALAGLERIRAEYQPRGVRVVLVAHDSDGDRLGRFADSAGVRIPIALAAGREHVLADPAAWLRLTAQTSFPKFLIIDAHGRVAHRTAGVAWGDTAGVEYPFPDLRSVLDSLLAPPRGSHNTSAAEQGVAGDVRPGIVPE